MCTAGKQLVEGRQEASSLTGIPFAHLLVLENFYRQQDDQFPTMLRTTSRATDYVASASLSPGLAMACYSSVGSFGGASWCRGSHGAALVAAHRTRVLRYRLRMRSRGGRGADPDPGVRWRYGAGRQVG